MTTLDAISNAVFGESCAPTMGLQKWCNVVDGVAQGFCGFSDVCRTLCDGPADCEGTGFDSQTFRFAEGRGFCGPIPEDG